MSNEKIDYEALVIDAQKEIAETGKCGEKMEIALKTNSKLMYKLLNDMCLKQSLWYTSAYLDVDDVSSILMGALLKAIKTYKPDKKVKFVTYAVKCMTNEANMIYRYVNVSSRKPSGTVESLSKIISEEGELTLEDVIPSSDLPIEEKAVNNEFINIIKKFGYFMSETERFIFDRKIYNPSSIKCKNQKVVEDCLLKGMSVSYVRRIKLRLQDRLKRMYQMSEMNSLTEALSFYKPAKLEDIKRLETTYFIAKYCFGNKESIPIRCFPMLNAKLKVKFLKDFFSTIFEKKLNYQQTEKVVEDFNNILPLNQRFKPIMQRKGSETFRTVDYKFLENLIYLKNTKDAYKRKTEKGIMSTTLKFYLNEKEKLSKEEEKNADSEKNFSSLEDNSAEEYSQKEM